MLEHFTGNVQRQILAVYQTSYEAEIVRQEVCALLHYHNAVGIELKPLLKVLGIVIKRSL